MHDVCGKDGVNMRLWESKEETVWRKLHLSTLSEKDEDFYCLKWSENISGRLNTMSESRRVCLYMEYLQVSELCGVDKAVQCG